MINRLISIGCDEYFHKSLSNLNGAVNDSQNVFDCLTNTEFSIYKNSKLLKSPSTQDVRSAIADVVFAVDTPDVLTIFFAGHGGVQAGTYYLCLNDTDMDRFCITAFPLSEIFRIVSSSKVKHVNLIIDACNAGGLVNDLTTIVNPELIGSKNNLGISILAAAASDEYANEKDGQGLLTGSLLKLIDGTQYLTGTNEYFDLVTLGRKISSDFIANNEEQTPSSWGLNLYGPSIFAKNPFYDDKEDGSLSKLSFIPTASKLGRLISDHQHELIWFIQNTDKTESYSKLLNTFQSLLSKTDNIDEKLELITGTGYRLFSNIDESDNFNKLNLINTLLTIFHPYKGDERVVTEITRLKGLFVSVGKEALTKLNSELSNDKYYLISGGHSAFSIQGNYFYLPIRISKILGVIGQVLLIDPSDTDVICDLLSHIHRDYYNHLITVSDVQASYLLVFFRACLYANLVITAKPFLVKYMSDFILSRGQVASINIPPDKALDFILQRNTQPDIEKNMTASPGHIGAVLLLTSKDYNIQDDVDMHLEKLDRRDFLYFIPTSTEYFSDDLIADGQNVLVRCGFDFWSVDEFCNIYTDNIILYGDGNYEDANDDDILCCVASSFIQPDRLALMLR